MSEPRTEGVEQLRAQLDRLFSSIPEEHTLLKQLKTRLDKNQLELSPEEEKNLQGRLMQQLELLADVTNDVEALFEKIT